MIMSETDQIDWLGTADLTQSGSTPKYQTQSAKLTNNPPAKLPVIGYMERCQRCEGRIIYNILYQEYKCFECGREYNVDMTVKSFTPINTYPHTKDEQTAEQFLINLRWPLGIECPQCNSVEINDYRPTSKASPFSCRNCRTGFNVKTGTVMQSSKILYKQWVIIFRKFAMGNRLPDISRASGVKETTLEPAYNRLLSLSVSKSDALLNAVLVACRANNATVMTGNLPQPIIADSNQPVPFAQIIPETNGVHVETEQEVINEMSTFTGEQPLDTYVILNKNEIDNLKAEQWFINLRWPEAMKCPSCSSSAITDYRPGGKPGPHRCRKCSKYFSVRHGTIISGGGTQYSTWLLSLRYCFDGHSVGRAASMMGISKTSCKKMSDAIWDAISKKDDPLINAVVAKVADGYNWSDVLDLPDACVREENKTMTRSERLTNKSTQSEPDVAKQPTRPDRSQLEVEGDEVQQTYLEQPKMQGSDELVQAAEITEKQDNLVDETTDIRVLGTIDSDTATDVTKPIMPETDETGIATVEDTVQPLGIETNVKLPVLEVLMCEIERLETEKAELDSKIEAYHLVIDDMQKLYL